MASDPGDLPHLSIPGGMAVGEIAGGLVVEAVGVATMNQGIVGANLCCCWRRW